jgi:hypothetical protein
MADLLEITVKSSAQHFGQSARQAAKPSQTTTAFAQCATGQIFVNNPHKRFRARPIHGRDTLPEQRRTYAVIAL